MEDTILMTTRLKVIEIRVVRGSILCDPSQPNPNTDL